jgi:hypothetical protein
MEDEMIGHAAHIGKKKKFLVQNHFEDPHADGKIILKWILKKQDTKMCVRFIRLRIGTSGRKALANMVMKLWVSQTSGNSLFITVVREY